MKKTVEELADNWCVNSRGLSFTRGDLVKYTFKMAYQMGKEEAQEWISVEDRLPEEHEYVLASKDGGKSWYTELGYHYTDKWFLSCSPQEMEVTHWREI